MVLISFEFMMIYWGEAICIIRKNTETLVFLSKKTGLEANAEKTKYMAMSRGQNAGQNGNRQIDNKSFVSVEQFKHMGTITNQNSFQEEIKCRLKSGNACYHLVQNLLFSNSLSKKCKTEIYRNIILPVVL
jgi:hypothetical protein